MAATQKNRFIAIGTALGADVLLLKSFGLSEQLGRLYHIEAELLSEDFDIDFNALVGTNVTLRLATPSGPTRFFNGCVSRFVLSGNEGNFATYRATIVPWLWLLTRTADCRIFQNKKVPEIIEEVFKGHGFKDYKLKLSATYRKWEYCVQYRETDFNFVSRLMELEGIYYYFEHDNGIHTLVLVDAPAAHDAFPGYDTLTYRPRTQAHDEHGETVTDWVIEREVQTGLWTLADFNFKTPAAPIRVNANINRSHEHAGFEIYDYPGEYTNRPEGDAYAKLRIQEIQSQHEILRGQSTVRGLATGHKFTLKGHYRSDQNRAYLVTETSLQASTGAYESAGPDGGNFFTCGFTAAPAAEPFRTARSTPKPIIQGPQTAIVVGRAGEEIDPDEFGRVKVQFHWDRQGKKDENSSCWVRVSQQWAGKSWGAIHTPRIGQEVIVEFLEGDPDRPIITGRVYNAEQSPPYGMPANKTQSGIKSNSSPGGGGSNELRFEDKKGGEEVYLHGEKDLRIHVKNNETETVGASISTNAGGSISRSAGANISRTADVTITDKAGKDIITNSGKNMDLQAGGSYQLHTNLGIHLKAMNFVASLIESAAKGAAAAVKKGGAQTAAEAAAGGGAGSAAEGAQNTGMSAVAALSPAIEAGAAEISALSAQTSNNISGVETAGGKAGEAAATFNNAVAAGASPAVIAGAFMAMASAAAEAWDSAKKVVEGLLPQIPNIELWAMKDVNAHALWSMTLSTKVKNISIEAQNKDINVQAKQNINLEAKTKDINIKASKKKVLITAKEEVNVTAEDKNLVIEAKKKKVFVKSADQIFLKCGSASISMSKNGNIVLKGAKININGSGPVTVKGTPIKLN